MRQHSAEVTSPSRRDARANRLCPEWLVKLCQNRTRLDCGARTTFGHNKAITHVFAQRDW